MDRLEDLFFRAMDASNEAIERAKSEGGGFTEDKNAYKELITLADKYVGMAVVSVLERSGIPIGLVQEEEEGIRVFNGNHPEYLFVLDEQDGYGLSLEKNNPHLRYGTMAAILEGNSPKWKDCVIGGVMEHSPVKRLVYGSRIKRKSFVRDADGEREIKTSGRTSLRKGVKILSDSWFGAVNYAFDIPFKGFGVKDVGDVGGSEVGYVDIALGKLDALGECTRKENQEPLTTYLMIKNAGGEMLAFTGMPGSLANFDLQDVGDWNYVQSIKDAKLERIPILTVATRGLGEAMIEHINGFYDWKGPLMKGTIRF